MKLIYFFCLFLFSSVSFAGVNMRSLSLPDKPDPILVVDAIREAGIRSPNVILWYFGPYGFTASGATFYQKEILSPLLEAYPHEAKIYLYDLTAWAALLNATALDATSKFALALERMSHPQIVPIFSRDFFAWLQKTDRAVLDYFEAKIFPIQFLWEKSADRKLNRKTISQVFGSSEERTLSSLGLPGDFPFENSEVIFGQLDTARAYSALQYLEGLYLVHTILLQRKEAKEVNIVFLLPNNEPSYYGEEGSFFERFERDLNEVVFTGVEDKSIQVNVYFQNFRFGSENFLRPYLGSTNADKKIKVEQLGAFLPSRGGADVLGN